MKNFRSSALRTLSLSTLGLLATIGLAQAAPTGAKPAMKAGTAMHKPVAMKSGSKMASSKMAPKKKGATMGTKVGLTSAQKAKVAAINKDAAAKRAAVTANKSLTPAQRTAQYKMIATAKEAKIKAVMSASQKSKYTKMKATKKAAKPAMKSSKMSSTKMAPKPKM